VKTLLLDANSIILLTRAGWIPESDDETVVASTGIAAYELGNAVWKDLHIFKRLSKEEAELLLTTFHKTLSRIKIDPQSELTERIEVLRNSDNLGISYIDSSYLTSAIRFEATLVTEDKGLRRAADACGILTLSAGELAKT
jgi:predicted nucleic acid-binding protein